MKNALREFVLFAQAVRGDEKSEAQTALSAWVEIARDIQAATKEKKAKTDSRLRRSGKLKGPRNCFELRVVRGKAWRARPEG